MVKEKLIAFEIGAGEGGGIVCAERVRPCGELPQRPTVGVYGALRVGACGKMVEVGSGEGGNALLTGSLRGGCAAFAASAHGGKIGESGLAWHDVGLSQSRMCWQRRVNISRKIYAPHERRMDEIRMMDFDRNNFCFVLTPSRLDG